METGWIMGPSEEIELRKVDSLAKEEHQSTLRKRPFEAGGRLAPGNYKRGVMFEGWDLQPEKVARRAPLLTGKSGWGGRGRMAAGGLNAGGRIGGAPGTGGAGGAGTGTRGSGWWRGWMSAASKRQLVLRDLGPCHPALVFRCPSFGFGAKNSAYRLPTGAALREQRGRLREHSTLGRPAEGPATYLQRSS
ncbi:hypothetical protein B0H10DRAFT_1951335 [Mycena sp. CBHHK59/15]|nr:hypothetical protein B0H10DRAFT_1951335 [Mycena sp. CBHHK59/15]